jgi:glutathione S-transferase
MAIEVYWASGSPFSWRVLLALEVKRLPYESHLLQFSKGDLETPAFAALNPRKKVPVVRDGDDVVFESIAILAYLDRKYPEPPLFGRTPSEAGRIWRTVCEQTAYFDDPVDEYVLPLYFGHAEQDADQIRAAVPVVQAELARLEGILVARDWLAGEHISAADLVAFPMVKALERASGKPAAPPFDLGLLPIGQRYAGIARWMARIEALPGYDRTYPPHWRA